MPRDYKHYETMDEVLLYDILQDAWRAVALEYITLEEQATSLEEQHVWNDALIRGDQRFRDLGRAGPAECISAMQAWDEEALRIQTAVANGDTNIRPLL